MMRVPPTIHTHLMSEIFIYGKQLLFSVFSVFSVAICFLQDNVNDEDLPCMPRPGASIMPHLEI